MAVHRGEFAEKPGRQVDKDVRTPSWSIELNRRRLDELAGPPAIRGRGHLRPPCPYLARRNMSGPATPESTISRAFCRAG